MCINTYLRPTPATVNLTYDEDGFPHGLIGEKLTKEEHEFLQSSAITAFDNDSGMTMLRIGSMNLMLHGIEHPHFTYADTLSKAFTEEKQYDLILANPPFKGAIDSSDVNPTLPTKVKKTEILFLHLFLRLLEVGGRAAVIVPDGVLFGTSNAHTEIRRKLSKRTVWMRSFPCRAVFSSLTLASRLLCWCLPRGQLPRIFGFMTWSTMASHLMTSVRRFRRSDIPDILDSWKNRT